ncbi:vitamin B12 dependent-methionine synthase activation domain-containing protein [Chloroflexota bacterium]
MLVTREQLDIEIDRRRVLRNLGYSDEGEPSAAISSLVNEYMENAHQLIEPAYSYVIRNVDAVRGSIAVVEEPVIFESQVIARLLERCSMVAVFLVTIGRHLEETAGRLADDDLILQSYVLDAIGSDAVEIVVDYVQDQTRQVAHDDGFVISRRFSPGYCDWDVSQQKVIFQAVNAASIEVLLTDECLMIPKKSISGIIGIGPSEGGLEYYNPCTTCDRRDCVGRRWD